jgi:hypothetical protein
LGWQHKAGIFPIFYCHFVGQIRENKIEINKVNAGKATSPFGTTLHSILSTVLS